jgi:DNA-binding NtrC family response regulator
MNLLFLDPAGSPVGELALVFREAMPGGGAVELVQDRVELLQRLQGPRPYDLVILDLERGDGAEDGLAITAAIRAADEEVAIVLVSDHGDVPKAARAIAAGATDLLVRGGQLPERVGTVLGKVRKHLRLVATSRTLRVQNRRMHEAELARYGILGRSPQMRELLSTIEKVARIPRPVLIVGERGTGKELIARAVHLASPRADAPMISINCAAFSDQLLENELFGHEPGAFTGAERPLPGKFEQASGGTLLLDEIGNMSAAFQQKILRVVEYGTFTRVGGTRELCADARIIAATNVDLHEKIAAGEFLADLHDRLSFEVLTVPPLRARPDDIELLAQHFLQEFVLEIPELRGKRLAADAVAGLRQYPFPGNVRELKHIIERAAYRETTGEITAGDLGLTSCLRTAPGSGTFHEQVERFKHALIERALEESHGNQAEAARRLGLSYHQLRYQLRRITAS